MEQKITEYNGLPVYSIILDNMVDIETGLQTISLVDHDAMEMEKLITFDKEEPIKMVFSADEKQMVTGIVIVKDKLIYRNNPSRYVSFSEETILKLVEKYFALGLNNNINLMHTDQFTKATLIESIITKEDNYLGFIAPKGSWMITVKLEDKQIFNDIKNGIYKGFSLEGYLSETLGMFDKVINTTSKTEDDMMKNLILNLEKVESEEEAKRIIDSAYEEFVLTTLENEGIEKFDAEWEEFDMNEMMFAKDLIGSFFYKYDVNPKADLTGYVNGVGPNTRSFCKNLMRITNSGKVFSGFTISQLQNPEFGNYSIFKYAGSFGCAHRWLRAANPKDESKVI